MWYREWNQDLVPSRQVHHHWATLLLSWFSKLAAKFVLFFSPVELKSWKAVHFKVEWEKNNHHPAFVKSWIYVASCLSPKLTRNLRLTFQWLVNEDIFSVLSREKCFLCAKLMPGALAFVLCLAVIFVDNKLSLCSESHWWQARLVLFSRVVFGLTFRLYLWQSACSVWLNI